MTIDAAALRRSVDLLALIAVDVDLRRTGAGDGGEYHGPCPFCGGRDRFTVWPASANPRWWCRGCNRRGDAIAYVREREGLGFVEACRRLGSAEPAAASTRPAAPAGPEPPGPSKEWQRSAAEVVERCRAALLAEGGSRARSYLAGRGLAAETIERYRLGFSDADQEIAGLWVRRGITIPWYLDGKLINVNVRRAAGEPKYQGIQGGSKVLFGADSLTDRTAAAILEGEFDAVLLAQEAGDLLGAVALGSARTTLPASAISHLLPLSTLLVAFDCDEAGDRAAGPLLDLSRRIHRVIFPGVGDATEFHQAGGSLRDWATFQLARLTPAPAATDEAPACGYCGSEFTVYGPGGRELCQAHADAESAAVEGSHLVSEAIEQHGAMLWKAV